MTSLEILHSLGPSQTKNSRFDDTEIEGREDNIKGTSSARQYADISKLHAHLILAVQNKAKDSDIVATSTVMSLKCPLSYMRLRDPCRGNLCNHNQCFDAMSYLQLQQQAPTWLCPICNRLATYESLQIDQWVYFTMLELC